MERAFGTRPKLVFDFKHSPEDRLRQVGSGEAPKESLLGYVQLIERGWSPQSSHGRWGGFVGRLRRKLGGYIELPSWEMLVQWRSADIVVVVTRLSLVLAVCAKLLGKRLVFLDAMQGLPKSCWRRFIAKAAIQLSDVVICYSELQAHEWATKLNIPMDRFRPLCYSVESSYYEKNQILNDKCLHLNPCILSVGRDQEREFTTLATLANKLHREVVLVTHPYLLSKDVLQSSNITVLQNLSYSKLFQVYSHASVTVVPIRRGVTYMSGIRATMESMMLNVPVVAARVSGLEEYFEDRKELIFYEPENVDSLIEAISEIEENPALRSSLIRNAAESIRKKYDINIYVSKLEEIFESLSC